MTLSLYPLTTKAPLFVTEVRLYGSPDTPDGQQVYRLKPSACLRITIIESLMAQRKVEFREQLLKSSIKESHTEFPLIFQIINYQPYGHSVDWWAYGVLLYEMLAGQVSWIRGQIGQSDARSQKTRPDTRHKMRSRTY